MAKATQTDLSSFMCVVLMLTGALITILISNVVVIAANPENVVISAVVRSHDYEENKPEEFDLKGTLFPKGNAHKEANYIDVHRDHFVLYPGNEVVSLRDLDVEDNALERFLNDIATRRESEYVVLLVRPFAANESRRLRKVIKGRGIDVGMELFEAGRPVRYEKQEKTPTEEPKAPAPAAPPAAAPSAKPGGS